jgi:hypothetical protein
MENFALQASLCNFLKLRISPWEVIIPFLLCSSSFSALSLPWRLLSFLHGRRSLSFLPPSAALGRHGIKRWRAGRSAPAAAGGSGSRQHQSEAGAGAAAQHGRSRGAGEPEAAAHAGED